MSLLALLVLGLVPAQEPSSQDRLKRAVEEARRELAAEGERLAKEDAAEESDLVQAKGNLSRLTDELVDLTGSVSRKSKDLAALNAEEKKLKQDRFQAVQTWGDLHRTASDMRQKLVDLLDSLPPSESRAAQKRWLDEARAELEHPQGEPFDPRPLLAAGRSLLAEAGTTRLFTQPIRNADGIEEDALVLRAGMIFHAYQGKKTGRIGEVATAPAGQAGYRWTESLPDWARRDLEKALQDSSGSAPAGVLHLPLDVTQRLAPERRENKRPFIEVLKAGGPVMIPLLAVGVLAILVTLERFVTLAAKHAGAREAAAVLESCWKGNFDEAARRAESARGLRARALSAALAARGTDHDRGRVEEAVRQAVLREMPALERFIPMLAVLAGVAPMLGLLGTVTGMITTFDVIRIFGSGDPGIMAGGISEALVSTATGLVIAIPILLVHSFVSGRVDRILADTQVHVAALMTLVGDPSVQEVPRG